MKKILIVDDSAFMRNILKDLLHSYFSDSEIYEADGELSASEQLKKVQPDLVLLDIVMKESELEGLNVLKEIKQFYPMTKVIMLTSVGQIAVIEECKKLGAEHYIEKPFDRDEVIKLVNKCLGMAVGLKNES